MKEVSNRVKHGEPRLFNLANLDSRRIGDLTLTLTFQTRPLRSSARPIIDVRRQQTGIFLRISGEYFLSCTASVGFSMFHIKTYFHSFAICVFLYNFHIKHRI